MAQPKRTKKSIDSHYAGSEPILTDLIGRSDPQLFKAFNWYNYSHDAGTGKAWLFQWMKQNSYTPEEISLLKGLNDNRINTTSCWYAKIALNGTKLHIENTNYVHSKIDEMIHFARTKKKEEEAEQELSPKKVIDLQARTLAKNNQIHSMAEEEVIDGSLSMYDFLKKYSVTPVAASFLKAKYLPSYEEVFCDDPQVKEAFGKSLKKYQNFFKTIIEDLDRYIGNKKVVKVRKARTPKEKPLSKLIEKLKYQKEFPELKIVSVAPQEIIGCQSLWTYNTKNRVLTVYHAQGPAGINVKGTTLIGWDAERSTSKGLRKPEVHIKEVLEAGKVAIRKVMDGITTKPKSLNGRTSEDTIILRVLK